MSPVFEACLPTLFVPDMEATARFYTGVMGFREVKRFGENIHLAGPGVTLALRPRKSDAPVETTSVNLGFFVRDITAAMEQLSAKGVTFIGDIVETRLAKIVFFSDPDGMPLYLCQWL